MNLHGVVTAVGPPLLVRIDGDGADITAIRLASYTPAAEDRVVVGQWGSQWVVLGKVV